VSGAGVGHVKVTLRPWRVLFVEDDSDQSFFWEWRLRDSGYRVTFVGNAVEAMAAAQAEPFDAVLMDIALGDGIGGIEAAARLRIARPRLAVIFMSAHGDGATLEDAKLAMPAGYLRKPFAYADLTAAIERVTRHAMPEISNDHDLLVRLDVKLDLVSIQLNEARALVAAKADSAALEPRLSKIEAGLSSLVAAKADSAALEPRLNKIEAGLSSLVVKMAAIGGGLVVVDVLLKFFK
jgi:DNA-binding response OmpR family regulator